MRYQQKKIGVDMLLSDITEFKTKSIVRNNVQSYTAKNKKE